LKHVNLLQLVSHHDTDSVRELGLLCCNKMLQSVRIMINNDTPNVFHMSVDPVTFGPICLCFHMAWY